MYDQYTPGPALRRRANSLRSLRFFEVPVRRRALGLVALALWWTALLVAFCEIPLRAPLHARNAMSFPGSALTEKLGRAHSLDPRPEQADRAWPDR